MVFMEETNPVEVQTCPRCKASWEGFQHYCPVCANPVSASSLAAAEEETRGCWFFVQMTFAMFFAFIGLALIVVGVAAASHDDQVMAKAYFPGAGITLIAGVVIFQMLRKYQREKRLARTTAETGTHSHDGPQTG